MVKAKLFLDVFILFIFGLNKTAVMQHSLCASEAPGQKSIALTTEPKGRFPDAVVRHRI